MNKLLKDAIADAKAVRATALAQAKLALEEAFAPKLQSMLSTKIKEEMEEEDPMADQEAEENMRMRELAGLAEKGDDFGAEDEAPAEDEFGGGEEGGEEFSDEAPAEDEFGGGEDFGGGEEGGDEFSDEAPAEDEFSSDDEDLEEILRQLEEEEEVPATDDEEIDFDQVAEADAEDEELNLDELISALRESDDEDADDEKETMDEVAGDEDYKKAPNQAMDTAKGSHGNVSEMKKQIRSMRTEINEAYSAVKFLRDKLSEVNLLNAKLLYVNKLFRKNGLTESQKVKIIETFDRARNVRETKLIYATLHESITAPKPATKRPVVENYASAPVQKTKVITEGNQQVINFQRLAGIIKS